MATSRPLVLFPSCNPERASKAKTAWRDQGYHVSCWTDDDFGRYPGYFPGVNQMISAHWGHYDLFICAADDIFPDPNYTADEIAAKYRSRFPSYEGVLQPCGDDLPGTSQICGSPWIGKAFIASTYHGRGPYFSGYQQFYGDEELLGVAERRNALWMCPSLAQRHEHWLREGIDKTDYQERNNSRWWDHDKALFYFRQGLGFPCSS